MSVNNMTFQDMSAVLTLITRQASGQMVETPTNTGEFISVAQVALNSGFDAVMNAISNVLSGTVFSTRPYEAQMKGLEFNAERWGNVMRKLSIVETDWESDPAFQYPILFDANQVPPDGYGKSVDRWKVKKPNVLQTLFTGQSAYYDLLSITQRQLETAFTGPDEFGSFFGMLMTNFNNRLESSNENIRRGLVCNAIGALAAENAPDRVVHLLTMYNSQIGEQYTKQDIYHPDHFPAFVKWASAKIEFISDMFTQRGIQYQTTITGKPILRHTPKKMQRVYLGSEFLHEATSRVLADTYHDTYLKLADVESLPYWQSMDSKDSVSVYPAYTNTSGTVVHDTTTKVDVPDVLGLIFDKDMMGMGILDRQIIPTQINGAGRYYDIHLHANQRCYFDNTEKGVLLLLD